MHTLGYTGERTKGSKSETFEIKVMPFKKFLNSKLEVLMTMWEWQLWGRWEAMVRSSSQHFTVIISVSQNPKSSVLASFPL